jgi:hypothetical protein
MLCQNPACGPDLLVCALGARVDLYRFRTWHRALLQLMSVRELRHDRGPGCLSACCTRSLSASSAGWSC